MPDLRNSAVVFSFDSSRSTEETSIQEEVELDSTVSTLALSVARLAAMTAFTSDFLSSFSAGA
jgi:hypothetical protein